MLPTLWRDLNGATRALPSTLPSNLDKDLRPEQKCLTHAWLAWLCLADEYLRMSHIGTLPSNISVIGHLPKVV